MLSEHGCGIAPNTYWVAKKRCASKRAEHDAMLIVEIQRVYDDNLFVYGADKIWTQLNNEGIRVARCTVERLMRHMGCTAAPEPCRAHRLPDERDEPLSARGVGLVAATEIARESTLFHGDAVDEARRNRTRQHGE